MSNSAVALRSPLYQQVKHILLRRLTAGEWKAGDKLPAEPVLARETGVSLGTLRHAVELLVADGVLTRRPGVGTLVRTFQTEGYWNRFQPIERLDGKPRFDLRRLIVFEHVSPPAEVAASLHVPPSEPVIRIVRHLLKLESGVETTALIDEDYLSPVVFPTLTEAQMLLRYRPEDSLYKFYDRELGVVITNQKCTVRCERVSGALAQSLGLPADFDQTMLRLERLSMTYGRTPAEHRITRAEPEHLQVAFDLT